MDVGHERLYRDIDFHRDKLGFEAKVGGQQVEKDDKWIGGREQGEGVEGNVKGLRV